MRSSQSHLKFFAISGSVLAIPGIVAACYGFFLVVPPILALLGIWLLIRSYKSLAPDDHKYRKFTLLATALFNGVVALLVGMFLLADAQNIIPYALLAYLILCTTIALLGLGSENSSNQESTSTPPTSIRQL